MDDTCQEYGETVCERMWNWLQRIQNLAEQNQMDTMTISFEDFLGRLSDEVDDDLTLPEALSPWQKKKLSEKIVGLFHLIKKRENPYQLHVIREDIRFFSVTLDVYAPRGQSR